MAAASCIINFCLSLAFLLIITFTSDPLRFSLVNGRQPVRFSRHYDHQVRKMIGIGSRPPRCDRLCKSCRDCEAVQVPIHGQDEEEEEEEKEEEENSRGDYIANYKPICWKCKCGDFIFNP